MSVAKLIRNGLPFANVAANNVATGQITPGKTLDNIQLALGGTVFTKALTTLIKLKANGKVFAEGSGTQFDKINAYRGETSDAAFLTLPFLDVTGITEFDRVVGAFDTSNVLSITSEVTIGAATAPTLKQILTEEAAQKTRNGEAAPFAAVMSKFLRYPWSSSVGGTLPIQLPFGSTSGAVIKRVHIEHTGNVTGATVKQDGLVIHESLKAENEFEQKRWKRVPQTNWYTIDFVVDGNMKKALDTRDTRSMEWLLTLSAADNGFVIVEYLDTLDNL